MQHRQACGVLALALGLSACGGGAPPAGTDPPANTATPSTAPAGATPRACDLLTDEEVSLFVGSPVTSQAPGDTAGRGTDCEWLLPGASKEVYTVRLLVADLLTYDALKSPAGTAIAGLGDEAWARNHAVGGLDLGVKVGRRSLFLDVDKEVTPDEARQMAVLILGRLNN
jgi:hypothetical protein